MQTEAAKVADLEKKLADDASASALKVTQLEQQLAEAQATAAKVAELEKQLSDSQTAGTQKTTELEARIADLDTQLKTHQDEAGKLRTELTAAQEAAERCKVLDEKIAGLERELVEARTALQSKDDEAGKLRTNLAGLETERDQLKLKASDSDNDGVSDADDKCPDTAEGIKVGPDGCEPDADQDGVPDRLDLCPNTPAGATVDAIGCHEKSAIRLEGVNFQVGTSNLTAESSAILESVAALLGKIPDNIEIAGHTDNTGSQAINRTLSQARAEAVKAFLIDKGVAADRLEAKGYGPDAPIAENDTAEGRAQNRRVELRRQ